MNATDVDDVAGVTLHYRLPGDGSFRDAKMTKNGDRWRATVTPVDQRPNADGKASYYVVGEDDLGKSRRSPTRTFTVNRCNFPATLRCRQLGHEPGLRLGDDGLREHRAGQRRGRPRRPRAPRSSTRFTPKGGGRRTASRSLAQTQVIGDNHYYSGQVGLKGLEPGSTISAYVQLTDKYGKTTKDRSPNDTFSVQVAAGC